MLIVGVGQLAGPCKVTCSLQLFCNAQGAFWIAVLKRLRSEQLPAVSGWLFQARQPNKVDITATHIKGLHHLTVMHHQQTAHLMCHATVILFVYLLQQCAVLLCAEGHGELIPAAEVTGQETLLVSRLCLLILQPICVLGSLRT